MSKLNIQNKLLSILDDEINDLEYQLFNVNCLSKSIKKSIAKKKKERNAVEASVLGNADEDKESLKEQLISESEVDDIVDSTGCGDSFAGGLTYGLLETGDYIKAGQFANVLGAQCLQGSGFEGFISLDATLQMIAETYS